MSASGDCGRSKRPVTPYDENACLLSINETCHCNQPGDRVATKAPLEAMR